MFPQQLQGAPPNPVGRGEGQVAIDRQDGAGFFLHRVGGNPHHAIFIQELWQQHVGSDSQ